jgi:hypothetical protein
MVNLVRCASIFHHASHVFFVPDWSTVQGCSCGVRSMAADWPPRGSQEPGNTGPRPGNTGAGQPGRQEPRNTGARNRKDTGQSVCDVIEACMRNWPTGSCNHAKISTSSPNIGHVLRVIFETPQIDPQNGRPGCVLGTFC